MQNLIGFPLEQLPFLILVVIIAFTLHEFAHAYAADRFGDPTPRSMGRVTLNPRVHIDLFGMLLIILVGFGWAKPVLIRPSFFKKPRIMNIIVSVVGPLSNLLLSAIGVLIAYILHEAGAYAGMSPGVLKAVLLFLQMMIMLNLVLFIFNLLPLPPLDGYRIVYEFLPSSLRVHIQRFEQWAFFLFLLLVFIDPLYDVTIGALFQLRWPLLELIDSACAAIFGAEGQLDRIGLSLPK